MLTLTVGNAVLTPAIILANRNVILGIEQAWNETTQKKLEYGGWIFYNPATTDFRTKQQKGQAKDIVLVPIPDFKDLAGFQIVADWHCHPDNQVFGCRPSDGDISNAKAKRYFMLVVTFKKQPKNGWPGDLLQKIQVVEDRPENRVWNII